MTAGHHPDTGLLHDLAGHLLRHAFNRGQHTFEVTFKGEGITPLQFMIVELVASNDGVAHWQICEAMGTSASVVTTTLKPLIEGGWISRENSHGDRRRIIYRLTKEGAARHRSLQPRLVNSEDLLLEALSESERREFKRMLLLVGGLSAREQGARKSGSMHDSGRETADAKT
jgi:DNA-binding MarR family transcriptional regulator